VTIDRNLTIVELDEPGDELGDIRGRRITNPEKFT
jgi:hypothetical protein